MKTLRLTIILSLVAATSVSSFAQTKNVFRAHGKGLWTDPAVWEVYNGSQWLPALAGEFPGESHNRDVNVVIADGSTIILGEMENALEINSLVVGNANLMIRGNLVVGPTKNVPREPRLDDAKLDNTVSEPTHDKSMYLVHGVDGAFEKKGSAALNNLHGFAQAQMTSEGPSLLQNMPNPVFSQSSNETTIRFYLDKPYDFVRLSVYDELGNKLMSVIDQNTPQAGWHNVRFAIEQLRSGSYPIYLELPGKVLHRLMSVIR